MSRINGLVFLAALAALAPAAAAQTGEPDPPAPAAVPAPAPKPVKAFFEAVGEFGGDVVGTVSFEDGSTVDLQTGRGLTVSGGAMVRPMADLPLALRASLGFKFQGTPADNANIFLTRVPVELTASYELPAGLWVAGGYARHMFTKLHADNLGDDLSFKDANGVTAEFGWRWIGVSYTSMRYTDEHGEGYDASVFGIVLTSAFTK